jgi:hypothetical protein
MKKNDSFFWLHFCWFTGVFDVDNHCQTGSIEFIELFELSGFY